MWWKLFHCPDATNWTNVLTLAHLLFTLPVSNGKLERVFSTMKNIKVDKRSTLSNESLEDLLFINTDQVSVKNFNPDQSIDLWWQTKTRRLSQGRSTKKGILQQLQQAPLSQVTVIVTSHRVATSLKTGTNGLSTH